MSTAGPTYRERLYAPWWLWAICTVIVATLGIAVGFPLGSVAGVAAGVVAEGAVVWVLVTASALVEVGAASLVAGRATLGYDAMGTVTALDGPAAGLLRGRDADPRAYLLLRPWVPAAVRVDVADPDDPAPYWYVSTRRPAAVAEALERARSAAPRSP